MADASFAAEFLEAHNEYRMLHGAPPLTLDPNLNCSAQAWADNLLEIRTLKHSDTNLGENLYYKYSCPPITITGNMAVDNWYNEIKSYDFDRPGFSFETGHFTQVVWKDSKELGVGMATDGTTTFVVGQYSPAGNISNAGYFERNVLPVQLSINIR